MISMHRSPMSDYCAIQKENLLIRLKILLLSPIQKLKRQRSEKGLVAITQFSWCEGAPQKISKHLKKMASSSRGSLAKASQSLITREETTTFHGCKSRYPCALPDSKEDQFAPRPTSLVPTSNPSTASLSTLQNPRCSKVPKLP